MIPRVMDVQKGSERSGVIEFNMSALIKNAGVPGNDNQICPFVQALYLVEGSWEVLYRSEVLRNTDRPEFPAFQILGHHAGHLLDPETFVRFELHHFEPTGNPHCIGGIESTLTRLRQFCEGKTAMFAIQPLAGQKLSVDGSKPISEPQARASTFMIEVNFTKSGLDMEDGDENGTNRSGSNGAKSPKAVAAKRGRRLSQIAVKGDAATVRHGRRNPDHASWPSWPSLPSLPSALCPGPSLSLLWVEIVNVHGLRKPPKWPPSRRRRRRFRASHGKRRRGASLSPPQQGPTVLRNMPLLTFNVLCGVQAMSSTKSGRMTYGTHGEDEKFLIELLEQQNIRETDLKVTHRKRHALSGGKPLAPHMHLLHSLLPLSPPPVVDGDR